MMKICLWILFGITVCNADPVVITCPADYTISLNNLVDFMPGNLNGMATAVPMSSTITFTDPPNVYDDNDDIRRIFIREWTATNGGNTDTCLQIIIIGDDVPPQFDQACPSDQTVECDNIPAAATLTATDPNYDSFVDVEYSENDPDAPDPDRTITRTWSITDDSGNSNGCTQTITVRDNTDPVITCPADADIGVTDDPSSDNLGVATGSDCVCWDDVSGYTLDITETDSLGATGDGWFIIERTWSATDGSDNDVSCTQYINVSCSDPDMDGVCNESGCSANFENFFECDDNCPDDANSGQNDDDGDGVGNACDTCPSDSNPGSGQTDDADGDDIPDACDICVNDMDNTDVDIDLYGAACGDCNDNDASINPGATEIFDGNGVDENCDEWCDMQNEETFLIFGTSATGNTGRICNPGQDQHQADAHCQTECEAWAAANGFITSGAGGPSGICMPSNPNNGPNVCECVAYKLVAC